jgi:acetoin utilization protein AcuC
MDNNSSNTSEKIEDGILFREELKEYDFGEGHPFRGDRYVNFYKYFKEQFQQGRDYILLAAEPATDNDLQLICHKNYIEFTRGYYESSNLGIPYPGKFSDFHSNDNLPTGKPGKVEEAARLVVGQAKLAAQLIHDGKFKKVISIGGGLHHAKPNFGEGFCLYNDVAFCALYLMHRYGLERILVLDTDAHCGNGTMTYFYSDRAVLFIDIHQDPISIYPGTGFVEQIGSDYGKGYTINVPLPEYAGDDAYRLVFESIVEPVVQEYKPQLIIRNGGSDPHFADGLTTLGLTMEGFRMIGEKVRKMSEICDGKLIDLIASGYNREVLPYAWTALISGLTGLNYKLVEPLPVPAVTHKKAVLEQTKSVIAEVKKCLSPYWQCLQEKEVPQGTDKKLF